MEISKPKFFCWNGIKEIPGLSSIVVLCIEDTHSLHAKAWVWWNMRHPQIVVTIKPNLIHGSPK
jgi:hypothetical protein